MFDFLKNIFGTKSEKDIKNLDSKVEEINEIFTSLNSISNNDLRAKTNELKIAIQSAVKTQNERITANKRESINLLANIIENLVESFGFSLKSIVKL